MDLEATVVERLQKLREWQLEQQDRLLKQQQMQRDMLSQRQDCIYKALELSVQELELKDEAVDNNNSCDDNGNSKDSNEKIGISLNESDIMESYTKMLNSKKACVTQSTNNFEDLIFNQQSPANRAAEDMSNIEDYKKTQSTCTSVKASGMNNERRLQTQAKQCIIDGVTPLSPEKSFRYRNIDDIPIPSPRKDFHVLLEERLKDSDNQSSAKSNNTEGKKVKKPFLRKGEGLSRFKVDRTQLSVPRTRSRSASFTNGIQSDSKYSKNVGRTSQMTQARKSQQSVKGTKNASLSTKQLCLKKVPLPKKKIRSKSECNTSSTYGKMHVNEGKETVELNTSDFQTKTQKEMEEVRIFELMEEKAENSSFCSTSSAVVAFLQQSTPHKIRNAGYKVKDGMLSMKSITPVTKMSKEQSILKANQVHKQTTFNKNDGSCNGFPYFLSRAMIQNNVHKNTILQSSDKNGTTNTRETRSVLTKHEVQNSKDSVFSMPVAENDNETDVSLHVRFSEYNEYKTIGLTDTSSISSESITKNVSDEQICNNDSTAETSSIQKLTIPLEMLQQLEEITSKTRGLKPKLLFGEYGTEREQNYNIQHSERSNNDPNYDMGTEDESEISDTADESEDDVESTPHNYNRGDMTPRKVEHVADTGTSRSHLEECNKEHVGQTINVASEQKERKQDLDESHETIFKSELLKSRLLELEQEINIFRKENAALALQRKKLEDDYRNLHKEYAEKEKSLGQQRKQAEDRLHDEKKKLAREKATLESRIRDSQEKAQQSKLERQEMQILRQEMEQLREDLHTKESRWNAAQSRHKCQMRILKLENSKLKQEIERLQSSKKGHTRAKVRPGAPSNTRAIHQINRQLNMQLKDCKTTNAVSSDDDQRIGIGMKRTNAGNHSNTEKEHSNDFNRTASNEKLQKCETTIEDVMKKRNLYEKLIKEATLDMTVVDDQSLKTSGNTNESRTSLNKTPKKLHSQTTPLPDEWDKSNKESVVHLDQNNKEVYHVDSEKDVLRRQETFMPDQSKSITDKQDVKEIQHLDGSIEYRFPNGNIKKIFPEQGITRLIYYNGDIRETNKDGKIKYFYASTRTWHTTMADGLEILEFADGQVERRLHNGTVEVSFPDGSVRILEPDGIEKWSLPDGTLIQILSNGEKILTIPNGQREIHTKTHKRREYPDGTVKLIHLDGTQETRYSNGRVRLKDKDGNLLMDSYQ